MSRSQQSFLVSLVLLPVLACGAPAPERASEDQGAMMTDSETIAARRSDILTALNDANIDALSQMVTGDLVAMPPNEPTIIGLEANQVWWRQMFDAGSSHVSFFPGELQVTGDWAFDRFTWTVDLTPTGGGETVRDEGKSLWIWQRQSGGTWKLAREIWNSDKVAPGL